MAYEILARKYRPQTFEEMVGQKGVVQTLRNALQSGRITQAYLFSGMRGTGKTTAARILAKALNCVQGPTATPCNACEHCTAIAQDRDIDVLEIDGASNRGIDDVRSLRESTKYRPVRARYKVIIIDEVHQVTREGFNALLKTLEEPPGNTVFVFATTEFHKVPATIVSRCQHFEFRKIGRREIAAHLAWIASKEEVTISPGSLDLIAGAAEGSLRDAQSLLDQAVAFSGENVRDEDVRDILGIIGRDLFFEASTAVLEEDPARIFPLVERIVEGGHDPRHFLKELIEHVRELLMVKTMAKPEDLLYAAPEDMERLRVQAERASAEDFLRYLSALQQAENGLRYASQPRIYLEALLVRLCHFRKIVPLQELIREVRGGEPGGEAGPKARPTPAGTVGREAAAPAAGKPPSAPRAAGTARTAEPSVRPPGPPAEPGPKRADTPRVDPPAAPAPSAGVLFARALEILKTEKPAVAAVLGEFSSVRESGGVLEVLFGPRKQDFIQIVRKELAAVSSAVARSFGRALEVRLGEETGETPAPPRPPETELALENPAVRHFMDSFQASVVRVDPLRRPDREPGD